MPTQCTIPDCNKPHLARGWCRSHYYIWTRKGDPLWRPTTEQRFWSYVDPCRTDGCALWLGATTNGYGNFSIEGEPRIAHHFLVGRPPKGMHWDHVKSRGCTHRNCVWPDHLELVTPAENNRRADPGAFWRNKTHCPSGHEYTPENTYYYSFGSRKCRACGRERWHRKTTELRR